jgi:Tol biopolymer transport system component
MLAAALVTAAVVAPAAEAAYPGKPGKILFQRQSAPTQTDVWNMNPDGSGQVRLTNLGGLMTFEGEGSYNGDGTRIAYRGPGTVDTDIFLMDASGAGAASLTGPGFQGAPAFSADGRKILFSQAGAGGQRDLFTINPDGTGQVNLTNTAGVNEFCGAFSPDGRRIYFAAQPTVGDGEIFSIKADGSARKQLTLNSLEDLCPDVSPDGTQIVFEREVAPGQSDIFVMNPDGAGQTAIISTGATEESPVYSPTGTQIAFSADTDGNASPDDVFVSDSRGAAAVNVTNTGPGDADVVTDWQPIPIRCGKRRSTIVGTNKGEKIRGTPLNDVIYAGKGKDIVNGFGGRDIICGAGGPDRLFGGAGKDRTIGGGGRDACFGGTGRDTDGGCESGKVKPRHKK